MQVSKLIELINKVCDQIIFDEKYCEDHPRMSKRSGILTMIICENPNEQKYYDYELGLITVSNINITAKRLTITLEYHSIIYDIDIYQDKDKIIYDAILHNNAIAN